MFAHLRAVLGGFHQSRPQSWRICLRAVSRGVAAFVLLSPTQTQRGACAPSAVQQAARRPSQTGVCIASTSVDLVDPQHLTKTGTALPTPSSPRLCKSHALAKNCAPACLVFRIEFRRRGCCFTPPKFAPEARRSIMVCMSVLRKGSASEAFGLSKPVRS